jgi:Flp pilus assembly protein TadD
MAQAAEAARAEEAVLTAAEAKAKAKAQRKSLQLGLALAASILIAAGIGALSWRRIELDRIARATALNGRVNVALREAMRQRGLAQGAQVGNLAPWAAAVAEAKQAESLLEPGVDPALRDQVKSLLAEVTAGEARAAADSHAQERERELLDRLVDIRSAKQDDPDGSATDTGYADAFREAGIDVEAKSPAEIQAALRSRPRSFVLAVVAHLDDWGQVRRHDRQNAEGAAALAAVAQALDGDPWRQKLREAIAQPEKERLAALQELAKSKELEQQSPIGLNLLGEALRESGDKVACERVLRTAQRRYPNDVWINYDLAAALTLLGRREEGIRFYTAARALRPETAHVLAHSLQRAGEHDEAIRIFQELTRLRPKEGRHLSCLGVALRGRGRAEEADVAYDAALATLQEEIRRTPTVATLHNALGIAYAGKFQRDEAIAAYRKAVELKPKDSTYRNNLRAALRSKVRDLQAKGQRDEALAIFRAVVEEDPKNVSAHEDYGGLLK